MALFRLSISSYSRHTHSGTIAPHVRYIGREEGAAQSHGPSMTAHVKHTRRARPQEAPKDDLVATGHQGMPAWVGTDPMAYWRAVDQYTMRRNGLLGKEMLLTLPRELDRSTNLELVQTFLARLPQNLPVSWAMHEPRTRNGLSPQPHAHIVVSLREADGIARSPAQWFRRYNPQAPALGGACVSAFLGSPESVRQVRQQWKALLLAVCQEHGLTLTHYHDGPEIRLSWQAMRDLKRLIQQEVPGAWGHEYRIPADIITAWRTQGCITSAQAQWLTQRSSRQLAYALTQAHGQLRTTQQRSATLPVWRLGARAQARQDVAQLQRDIAWLVQRQQAMHQLRYRYVNPALARQQQRHYQRQLRQHVRRLTQARSHAGQEHRPSGPGWELSLDEELTRRQRQREHGRGW